jgi:hypothetical protein
MNRTFEEGRVVVELKPAGIQRWIVAGFLSFWLVGWSFGEVAGLGLLLGSLGLLAKIEVGWLPKLASSASGPAAIFGLVWVSFWTLGGVMAARELLGMLWGTDRIEVDGAGVRRTSRIGPLAWTRVFAREELRGVGLRRAHLVLETRRGPVTLTRYGSPEEHGELKREIERALAFGSPGATAAVEGPPQGWEHLVDLEGAPLLKRSGRLRARQAALVWVLFAALAAAAATLVASAVTRADLLAWIPAAILTLFAAAALAGAAWLSFGGEAIRMRPGEAEVHRWFGSRKWVQSFRPAHLKLEHQLDSDGDDTYQLVLRGAAGAKTLARALYEPYELERLGRWMAAKLDCSLELPSHMKVKDGVA